MANPLKAVGKFLSYHFNDAPGSFTYAAAMNNFAEVDRLLGKYGPELVNKVGIMRSSGLMNAARNGHEQMVDHLIARGAEVNYGDHTGFTALMAAAANGQQQIFDKLVAHGANRKAVDKYGHDVDWYAARGKARLQSAARSSSGENYMTSPANLASPLSIFNPLR